MTYYGSKAISSRANSFIFSARYVGLNEKFYTYGWYLDKIRHNF